MAGFANDTAPAGLGEPTPGKVLFAHSIFELISFSSSNQTVFPIFNACNTLPNALTPVDNTDPTSSGICATVLRN